MISKSEVDGASVSQGTEVNRTSPYRRPSGHVSFIERTRLQIQRLAGRLSILPLGGVIVAVLHLRGHRIHQHAEVRKKFLEIVRSGEPMIVVANHLTLVDSVFMHWALASMPRYFLNYRLFSWNFPAVENTRKKRSWSVITYLSKCMLVDRLGDANHTGGLLAKMAGLLRQGDLLTLFPEGTRSRSGRVDLTATTYGIGKLVQAVPNCRVLCVYMRGRMQDTFSDFPKRGDIFDVALEVISPSSSASGLRGAKERSMQVTLKLKEMEERHFEQRAATIDRQ